MNIEFKRQIRDEVWIMSGNKPVKCTIFKIEYRQGTESGIYDGFTYRLLLGGLYELDKLFIERDVFDTKEDLINSL